MTSIYLYRKIDRTLEQAKQVALSIIQQQISNLYTIPDSLSKNEIRESLLDAQNAVIHNVVYVIEDFQEIDDIVILRTTNQCYEFQSIIKCNFIEFEPTTMLFINKETCLSFMNENKFFINSFNNLYTMLNAFYDEYPDSYVRMNIK